MFQLSITGADNSVSVQKLQQLTKQFSNVEFAILYFPEKDNQPRNPGISWRNEFFSSISKKNTALHLCGKTVFEQILETSFYQSPLFKELQKAQRIQLNINARFDLFEHETIHKIYQKLLEHNFSIILQYNQRSKNWILPFLKNQNKDSSIHILLDSSLGKGVFTGIFEIPQELLEYSYPIGFAGGLNPENIQQAYTETQKLQLPRYWLDLESGARSHNQFDLEKVQLLCNICFK